MCVLISSKTLSEISFISKKKWARHNKKFVLVLIKIPVIFVWYLWNFISLDIFSKNTQISFFKISLFHRAFRFTKFYLYQRMHLFLSYTKIT